MKNGVVCANKEPYKIVLVGKSSVGKTSVFKRLGGNDFNPEQLTSFGFESENIWIDYDGSQKIKLMLWDTAGQERYRAVSKSYYQNADGFFLLYDITNRSSFLDLEMWINNIKESGKSLLSIYILGNKCDMKDKREVSIEEGQEAAQKHNAFFMETSAKTNENLLEVAERIGKDIHAKLLPFLKKDKAKVKLKEGDKDEKPKNSCC